jgi:hypothetical protein
MGCIFFLVCVLRSLTLTKMAGGLSIAAIGGLEFFMGVELPNVGAPIIGVETATLEAS